VLLTRVLQVNRTVENIGARRLHTVVEKIMEDISFTASDRPNTSFEVDEDYVKEKVKDYLKATDLRKYII
jgi:ATP-dependent HslUV protease ATP-binding subunit HslU